MGKNICISSDGTGQAGGVRPDQRLSNVYNIYRAARVDPSNSIDPAEQVCFYDPGLGTDDDIKSGFTGIRRALNKLLSSATGRGITKNIIDCYEEIMNLYEPGDRIYLFGFSRGAYTARCVANLISLCGIPTTDGDGNPLPRYTSKTRAIAHEAVVKVYEYGAGGAAKTHFKAKRELGRRFRLKYCSGDDERTNVYPYFVGVFDTVASLGSKGLVRFMISAFLVLLALSVITGLSYAASWLLPLTFWKSFGIIGMLTLLYTGWRTFRSSFKRIEVLVHALVTLATQLRLMKRGRISRASNGVTNSSTIRVMKISSRLCSSGSRAITLTLAAAIPKQNRACQISRSNG